MLRSLRRRNRALTLVEIMIALLLATFISLGFMGSVVFMLRQNAANKQHFMGVQTANYYQALLWAVDFDIIGDDDGSNQFEASETSPLIVKSDDQYDQYAINYRVWFEHEGWGRVTSSTGTSITVDLPDNQDPWVVDQWKDNFVTIYDPAGDNGRIALIVGNNANTLTTTTDLSGAISDQAFSNPPAADSVFFINNGKTVNITVQWGDGQDYKTIQRSLLRPCPTDINPAEVPA